MRSITIYLGEPDERRKRKEKRGGAALVLIIGAVAAVIWASSSKPVAPVVTIPEGTAAAQSDAGWQRDSEEPPPPVTESVAAPPIPATLAVQPRQLAFQQQNGAVPAAQFIRVRNSGQSPLAFRGATTASTRFRPSTDCPPQLAADESCAVAVVFDPTPGRNATDTLTIRSDAGNVQIRLTGAAPPLPAFELPPIEFDPRIVGAGGEPRNVRLTNARLTALTPGPARVGAPFRIVKDGCQGATLPAGGGCDLAIDFDPPAAATYTGELTIAAPDGTLIARAPVRGIGTKVTPVAVKLQIEPRRLDFSALLPHSKRITVSNPNPRAVKITDVSIVPKVFDVTTDCLDKPLEPNGRCSITVSRRMVVGAAVANIIVHYDGGEEIAGVSARTAGKK
jgi:hypothetical protein